MGEINNPFVIVLLNLFMFGGVGFLFLMACGIATMGDGPSAQSESHRKKRRYRDHPRYIGEGKPPEYSIVEDEYEELMETGEELD